MKILWDGQITARDVSGNKQDYKYDLKGQLMVVVDATGKAVEQYVYDAAGNILSKTIDGKFTTFKYDKANQLVSSTDATGKVTHYNYDAAGRLTKEGDKSFVYGWQDKIVNISENGKLSANFEYGIDSQLSSRTDNTGRSELFVWDGLALIKRDSTNFVNEAAITGGNPILAFGKDNSKVLFEDILGSSIGSIEGGKFNAINRSAFGESNSDSELNFFTGKPQVEGVGYSFLFRNYRADQGKWQTQDPLGYPGGWNNLAYVNNRVTVCIDLYGMKDINVVFVTNNTTSTDAQAFIDSGKYDAVIPNVSSPTDLIAKAQQITSNGDKITLFGVSGHANSTFTGASTQAGLSDPSQNINIQNFTQDQISSLKGTLSTNAEYASYGCQVGQNQTGLKAVADALGIQNASGYTGYMPSGPNDQSLLDIIISFFTGGSSWYSTKNLLASQNGDLSSKSAG